MLKDLNKAQMEAVLHIENPLLILAGAGSGKTKTLTTRLAYLIKEVGIPPENTLTLTFTNKAAREMQTRAFDLLKERGFMLSNAPLLTTFHKFGLIFLRQHSYLLNISPNFILRDSEDKKKILKNLDKNNYKKIDYLISHFKSLGLNDKNKDEIFSKLGKNHKANTVFLDIFSEYENILRDNDCVDFDDLILLPYLILNQFESLRYETSQKYNFIMIDEYQDTNTIQYKLVKQLCSKHNNICVVGDDDQSIYGWRGANINNILNFSSLFKDTKIIKLETNYRSSENILNIANNLISFNDKRLGKNLISNKGAGEEVKVMSAENDKGEISQIIKEIDKIIQKGDGYSDIAILFRLNSLSRFIEEGLGRRAIPFQLIGATRFYERMEIKDALSYLRLIVNLDDNLSFERIINRPRRGIGEASINKILNIAKERSVYKAYKDGDFDNEKYYKKLSGFFDLIERLRDMQNSIQDFIDFFEREVRLYDEEDRDNEERLQNLREFYGVFRDFFEKNKGANLQEFLNDLSLDSNLVQESEELGKISCMSVHSSKGLEFKNVFIVGLEDGIFPLIRTENSESIVDIEEERRLAYVAITRAKERLFLSYSSNRSYRGRNQQFSNPSRFFQEMKNTSRSKKVESSFSNKDLSIGECVSHKIFGVGRIERIGSGDSFLVNFGGVKRNLLKSSLSSI